MLARKGYPPGLAFRLIREAMQQEGAELDEMDADQYLDPDAEDDARTATTTCRPDPQHERLSATLVTQIAQRRSEPAARTAPAGRPNSRSLERARVTLSPQAAGIMPFVRLRAPFATVDDTLLDKKVINP